MERKENQEESENKSLSKVLGDNFVTGRECKMNWLKEKVEENLRTDDKWVCSKDETSQNKSTRAEVRHDALVEKL